jgi:hypothetical protein
MQKFGDLIRGVKQTSRKGDGPPKIALVRREPLAGPTAPAPEQRRMLAVQRLMKAFEKRNFCTGIGELVDPNLQEALKKAMPEQIDDLAKCVEMLNDENHADMLSRLFCMHFEKGIFWLPFVKKEILPYTPESGTTLLFAGDDKIDRYLSRFMDSAVSFIEAEKSLGLSKILTIFSGRKLFVEISHEKGFSTFPNGIVNVPPVCWEYEKKEHNRDDYKQGVLHEMSHHKYRSFRVNLHPGVFDYDAVPFDFVEIKKGGDGPCVVVEGRSLGKGEKKKYDIAESGHIYALVEKPVLLRHIWNILEDRRIDYKHVTEFPGSRRLYEDSYSRALEHARREITDDSAGAFEAFTQIAVIGRTKNPIPSGVDRVLQDVWKILEGHNLEAEDSTDSLACAFRIYGVFHTMLPGDKEGGHTNFNGNGGADASKGSIYLKAPLEHREKRGGWKPKEGDAPGNGNQDKNSTPKKQSGGINQGGNGKGRKKLEKECAGRPSKHFRYDSLSSRGKIHGAWSVQEVTPEEWDPVHVPRGIQERVSRALRKIAKNDGILIDRQESGDPDIEAMGEHRRMRKAGIIIPPDYYSDVRHIKRSVLLGQLIDFSGSMDEGKVAKALAAAKALEGGAGLLKDDVITMGFGGVNPVKICALGWPGHPIQKPRGFGGATPLGGAIRHMAARMQGYTGKHHKKLVHLMVITDGQPNVFAGKGLAVEGEREAVRDSAGAVKDARKLGIKIFGLIILNNQKDEAKFRADYDKIFGRGQYYLLKNIEYLPAFLQRYYRRRVLKQGER